MVGRSVARTLTHHHRTNTHTHRHENTRAHRHTTTPPTHSRPNDFSPLPRYLPPFPRPSAVGGLALSLSDHSLTGGTQNPWRARASARSLSQLPPPRHFRDHPFASSFNARAPFRSLFDRQFRFLRAGKFLVRTISC